MAKIDLKGMDVDALLTLRRDIDGQLDQCRADLRRQLARLGEDSAASGRKPRKGALAGRKVAPKYRSKKDPSLTWAGRGATPLWMREEMKAGKLKKDAFLIN